MTQHGQIKVEACAQGRQSLRMPLAALAHLYSLYWSWVKGGEHHQDPLELTGAHVDVHVQSK